MGAVGLRRALALTRPDPGAFAVPAPTTAGAATSDPVARVLSILTAAQLARVTPTVAMYVPAVRSGHAKVTKTPTTWPLRAWSGDVLTATQPAWMRNPDPRRTYFDLIASTLDQAVWHDVAYWRVTQRGADGYPLAFELLDRDAVVDDAQGVRLASGELNPGPVVLADGRILESILPMRWHGLGGLARAGSVVVELALALLSAALTYANDPQPQQTLVNESPTMLTDDEIDTLLDGWTEARQTRGTAFLQNVKLESNGWSAKELQLVEAREHAALEVARAMALPAWAVEASNGASLTYSTQVENRRDLVEALRLWTAPLEQTLSLYALPRGVDALFDVKAYLRDDAETRMRTWQTGIAAGVLTVDEARAAEPLATGKGAQ